MLQKLPRTWPRKFRRTIMKAERLGLMQLDMEACTATMTAPADAAQRWNDEQWLAAIQLASKIGHGLQERGFVVNY